MTDRIMLKKTSILSGLSLGAALLVATSASAHFIGVGGNNSIDGSLCVGNDCVAEEAFGFDTVRLKENNLRLHFEDTSAAASFPPNDWRIIINDSANGGASYFAVEDASAGRIPFRVSAGARSNALFVDSQGDVGIGTSTPATDIDIKIGDTPTVRLQQDGTSGFTPQSWDLAGNETNFFIRDVTNGSLLPFRIRPGAPTSSIFIQNNGRVGMGAGTSPDAPLEVRAGSGTLGTGTSLVKLASTGDTQAVLQFDPGDDGTFWNIDANVGNNILAFSRSGTGGTEMTLDNNGDLTIRGGLITTGGGGACTGADPCDAVFDPAVYTVPSIEEHAALMWEKKHLPAVGPTGPDMPINMTEKMLRMLNELEHAHIYIEQLHTRVAEMEAKIATLTQ